MGNATIWLIQVRSFKTIGASEIQRRFLVRDLEQALEVLGSQRWGAANLYTVRFPLSDDQPPLVMQCRAIWECLGTEDDRRCWRIKTVDGVMLASVLGTALRRERILRQGWFGTHGRPGAAG